MVGGEDCHNRLSAFTQNNVLQHIYSVGKTFTVLALSEVAEDPCGFMRFEKSEFRSRPRRCAKTEGNKRQWDALLFGYFGAKVAVKQRALGGHALYGYGKQK